jgi:hypothetical protein
MFATVTACTPGSGTECETSAGGQPRRKNDGGMPAIDVTSGFAMEQKKYARHARKWLCLGVFLRENGFSGADGERGSFRATQVRCPAFHQLTPFLHHAGAHGCTYRFIAVEFIG